MYVRTYQSGDCQALAALFFDTVHTVNARDYTPAQLAAWATGTVNLEDWNRSFLEHDTRVAQSGGVICGFADMDADGYLDRLYVAASHQGQGIATALLSALEQHALAAGVTRFSTHASITAKPFFEKRGYQVVRENRVVRGEVTLTNFVMVKPTTP
ncbi:MAG: GNAT family N-acetyltransferase [Oscillibacter sp.]